MHLNDCQKNSRTPDEHQTFYNWILIIGLYRNYDNMTKTIDISYNIFIFLNTMTINYRQWSVEWRNAHTQINISLPSGEFLFSN